MFTHHKSARFIKQNVGHAIWNNYFKFCFERNPFDRAVSLYHFSTRPPAPRPSISEYLESKSVTLLSNWGIYTLNDHVAVDFIGRYEALEHDFHKAMDMIGLPSRSALPRTKTRFREDRQHYSKVLGPQDRSRIERVCAKEMGELGYQWEEPDNR